MALVLYNNKGEPFVYSGDEPMDAAYPTLTPNERVSQGFNALQSLVTPDEGASRGFDALGAPLRQLTERFEQARERVPKRSFLDKLFGTTGPRYQTWPEHELRSGFTAPGEAYRTGMLATTDPYGRVEQRSPVLNLVPGQPMTGATTVSRALNLAGLMAGGSIPAAAMSDAGRLGVAGGRMTQPKMAPESVTFKDISAPFETKYGPDWADKITVPELQTIDPQALPVIMKEAGVPANEISSRIKNFLRMANEPDAKAATAKTKGLLTAPINRRSFLRGTLSTATHALRLLNKIENAKGKWLLRLAPDYSDVAKYQASLPWNKIPTAVRDIFSNWSEEIHHPSQVPDESLKYLLDEGDITKQQYNNYKKWKDANPVPDDLASYLKDKNALRPKMSEDDAQQLYFDTVDKQNSYIRSLYDRREKELGRRLSLDEKNELIKSDPGFNKSKDVLNNITKYLVDPKNNTLYADPGRVGAPLAALAKSQGPFYSAVEHAVVNAPQAKMTADQWNGWLRNQPGVKKEELDWLGFPEGSQQMTRAEMLEHAQGHGPQIKEVEKIGDRDPEQHTWRTQDEDRALEAADSAMYEQFKEEGGEGKLGDFNEWLDQRGDQLKEHMNEWLWENAVPMDAGGTKYSDYQLPGGDNYRELLLTMPTKTKEMNYNDIANLENQIARYNPRWSANQVETELQQQLQDIDVTRNTQHFTSSHWDEPNVLVHMRMNDRVFPTTTAEAVAQGKTGFKSLHLEEVQSDWHQQGRKKGYASSERKEKMIAAEKKAIATQQMYGERDPRARAARDEFVTANDHYRAYQDAEGVPDAPFKSTWADLALKRAISKAAREGYDAISWTPGEQQAARYDLSKHADKVTYNPDTKFLRAWKNDKVILGKTAERNELAGVVGKDVADKLLKASRKNEDAVTIGVPEKVHELSGLDLKVGGEGMKRFYDKMLVDKANAIAKKLGGKVERKELPEQGYGYEIAPYKYAGGEQFTVYAERAGPEGESESHSLGIFNTLAEAKAALAAHRKQNPPVRVPVLRLTPKMKEVAGGRGMPLFTSGLPFAFTPVDHDPFAEDDMP